MISMAIDAKISFTGRLTSALAGTVTVEQMETIRRELMNILDEYEMKEIGTETGEDDLLECYLSAMQVECRSKLTIERYRYVIGRMMQQVKVPTKRITVYHLRSYIAEEKNRGVSDSTLEGIRQVFSGYFNWLQRECLIEKNPMANLGTIKCAKREKKSYTEVELEKLNMNCETVRDRAIINFLASTGCRISEMTGLDRDAVDLERLECDVHGKGNKERTVYLSEVAAMLLKEYLESRKDEDPALFVNRYGERIKPGGVREMLNRVAEAAGVEHVHPHKFRRTLATELTRHGMPIQEVARILGHDKLDTTMRYVVMNKEDVRASYRRYA